MQRFEVFGWLGAKQSLADLDLLAAAHWLPKIREKAAQPVQAIRSTKGRGDPPPASRFIAPSTGWDHDDEPVIIDESVLHRAERCPANRWRWQSARIAMPDPTRFIQKSENQTASLRLAGGQLTGVDKGEWGGELSWQPDSGQRKPILKDTFIAMPPYGDGAIALFELTHLRLDWGYALNVTRNPAGDWKTKEVARLLGEPDGLVQTRHGLFAARTAARVVALSPSQGVVGLAARGSR